MKDSDNKKDYLRKKFQSNHFKKNTTHNDDDDQKMIKKSHKHLKRKLEDIRAEERWEDWEDQE